MKKPWYNIILICSLFTVHCSLNAQQCEYVKSYAGLDFGVSVPTQIFKEEYKVPGLRIRSMAVAVKARIRFIPYGNCDHGNKYLVEAELRGDRWQHGNLEGSFLSVSGGIEHWIGARGYVQLFSGISLPLIDSVCFEKRLRPYASLRIGHGQFYLQPVIMPRINKESYRPTMIYLTIGFKNFSISK